MARLRRSSVVSVERANNEVARVEDDAFRSMSVSNPDIAAQTAEAKHATDNEHNLTVRNALKLYPKAVMFSLLLSTAVIMEGYDLSLMGSFFGYPQFKNRCVHQHTFFLSSPPEANPFADTVPSLTQKMEAFLSRPLGNLAFKTVSKLGVS